MGYDPTGHFDWDGVVLGAGIIIITAVSVGNGILSDPTVISGCLATGGVMMSQ